MYNDIAKSTEIFNVKYPKTLVPIPTDTDYELGFIRRYFIRRSNDESGHIFEIDESTYNEYFDSPFWIATDIKWRISGPRNTKIGSNGEIEDMGVVNSNKAAISLGAKQLKNLKLYLPNLTQFYKS
jgi:hypothetical protein